MYFSFDNKKKTNFYNISGFGVLDYIKSKIVEIIT